MSFLRKHRLPIAMIGFGLLIVAGIAALLLSGYSSEPTRATTDHVPPPVEWAPTAANPGTHIDDPDQPAEPHDSIGKVTVIRMCSLPHVKDVYAGSPDCYPSTPTSPVPVESTPPVRVMIDTDLSDLNLGEGFTGRLYVWDQTSSDPETIAIEVNSQGYRAILRAVAISAENVVDVSLSQKAANTLGFGSSTPTAEFTLIVRE